MNTPSTAAVLIAVSLYFGNTNAQQQTPPESVQAAPSLSPGQSTTPPATSRRSAVRVGQAPPSNAPGTSAEELILLRELEAAANPKATAASSQYGQRLHQIVNRAQPGAKGVSSPLIIRFGPADPKSSETLEEDLGVMSLLLEKSVERSVGQSGPDYKMGIPILTRSDGQSTRALYLDGFGALFFLNVNIPLVAPPPAEEVKEHKAPVDSDWENAKRELYSQPVTAGAASGGLPSGMTPDMVRRYFSGGLNSTEAAIQGWYSTDPNGLNQAGSHEYNAEQVESLKLELSRTLKNAANIRGLRADEHVAITVLGAETLVRRPLYGYIPKGTTIRYVGESIGKGSTLTLRAKKSDMDAFAKGTIGPEDFQKRVTIHVGAGTSRVRSGASGAAGSVSP